jgi:DNA-directed RNA polymerase I, II, and III subunit RPABC2
MSDYENEDPVSEYSESSNRDALEHSYGDDQEEGEDCELIPAEDEDSEDGEFEVREVNEAMREKEEYFRKLQKEDERTTPVPANQRITLDVLSKYEKARVLGVRAVQLASSAPTYADILPETLSTLNALQIAEEELRQQVIPFVLRRHLPDGHYEDWHLHELMILH